MQGAVGRFLSDGRRLHLQHGPIDLVLDVVGEGREAALARAEARFGTVLGELVADLDLLRRPCGGARPSGPVAQRMLRAVAPFSEVFVTPMAAVAGAVADEIRDTLAASGNIRRAYVNNGGDIAFYLAPRERLVAQIHEGGDAGRVRFDHAWPVRGVATSGWRGRSHSLGIADAVTVVAPSAATADAAATLVANAVDLPGHPAIRRVAARELAPESDLGQRLVTVDVGPLGPQEMEAALAAGHARAADYMARGLITGAALLLGGRVRLVGDFPAAGMEKGDRNDARFQLAQDGAFYRRDPPRRRAGAR